MLSFSSTAITSKIPSFTEDSITSASALFVIFAVLEFILANSVFNDGFCKSALTFQYSTGSNALISFSLSTIILTATL